MGDFNQDLAPTHYYGFRLKRNALVEALDECGLVALTSGEGDPIRRETAPLACINHICALRDSKWISEPAIRWPQTSITDARLSDHFGLSVKFTKALG